MAGALIMGIVNVTPDSFSDGGRYADPAAALTHARALAAAGADIVDVGGESTRPGSARVPAADEIARIEPVVARCAAAGLAVSVDTVNAATAERAIAAGATYINDVSGGLHDPDMYAVLARHPRVRYILGHWRGTPETMAGLATYTDVLAEVTGELEDRLRAARAAGLSESQIIVDPGLGFAKDGAHNFQIIANLERVHALGYPVLIGASRKRFLAAFAPAGAPATDRDLATAVLSALLAGRVWGVRVHDVAASRAAIDVAEAIDGARRG